VERHRLYRLPGTGTVFCSCSGPRLPDALVRTADDVYLRLHGPKRWCRHDYSDSELAEWVDKIRASGARRAWVYFNNDYEGFAPRNALTMRGLLESAGLQPARSRDGQFQIAGGRPMSMRAAPIPRSLVANWPLPASATLGSSVRTRRIEREIRARLPLAARKCVVVEAGNVAMHMEESERDQFKAASAKINKVLERIQALPVLPREAEDILSISARERQKWLKDGRLKSIGTRTVKMRGRAKKVTFHVFDPREIEEVLDRDLPTLWREEDALEVAENRRRGAGKAAQTRSKGSTQVVHMGTKSAPDEGNSLMGWDAFDKDGLLRDP
jgi:hypothetical protein